MRDERTSRFAAQVYFDRSWAGQLSSATRFGTGGWFVRKKLNSIQKAPLDGRLLSSELKSTRMEVLAPVPIDRSTSPSKQPTARQRGPDEGERSLTLMEELTSSVRSLRSAFDPERTSGESESRSCNHSAPGRWRSFSCHKPKVVSDHFTMVSLLRKSITACSIGADAPCARNFQPVCAIDRTDEK